MLKHSSWLKRRKISIYYNLPDILLWKKKVLFTGMVTKWGKHLWSKDLSIIEMKILTEVITKDYKYYFLTNFKTLYWNLNLALYICHNMIRYEDHAGEDYAVHFVTLLVSVGLNCCSTSWQWRRRRNILWKYKFRELQK